MKKAVVIMSSVLLLGLLAFQDKEQVIYDANAVVRKTARGFTAISVDNNIELYLSPAAGYSLAVSAATEELRNKIKTEVVEGELRIYVEGKSRWIKGGGAQMRVYVGCPTLERLVAKGASTVRLQSKMSTTNIKLDLSGASDFKGAIDAETLMVVASGASDAEFTGGKTNQLKVNASGASNLKAYKLFSNNCTVDASGASDVQVQADKSFRIFASGASDVHYMGKGETLEIKSTGSSSVKRKGTAVIEA